MERQELYKIIFDQQKEFLETQDKLIEREAEQEILLALKTKMPIIIVGVRRCGKSSILKLLKEKLKLEKKQFLYINFNDERLIGFSTDDFQKISEYMLEQNFDKNITIFLDEIQETIGWEKWIDRVKEKYRIFITGSNSKLLSSEISTILTGRAITQKIYPFSFKEFLTVKKISFKDIDIDSEKQAFIRASFKEYLEYGGFPKYVTTSQKIILSELYENILYKDIVSRFNSKQHKGIKEILQHIISNISKPLSTRTLSEISGIKNLTTIKKVLDTLEMSFLILPIQKFDYSVRKQIQNPKKIYCIDNGIINMKGFKMSENKGTILENAVFLQLKRLGKEIYYYKEKVECDFIIRENNKITEAMQVCYDLNEENKEREINGLTEAMKEFKLKKGTIITLDQEDEFKIKGKTIKVIPAWKWMTH